VATLEAKSMFSEEISGCPQRGLPGYMNVASHIVAVVVVRISYESIIYIPPT
jgi:hypothetical protein